MNVKKDSHVRCTGDHDDSFRQSDDEGKQVSKNSEKDGSISAGDPVECWDGQRDGREYEL